MGGMAQLEADMNLANFNKRYVVQVEMVQSGLIPRLRRTNLTIVDRTDGAAVDDFVMGHVESILERYADDVILSPAALSEALDVGICAVPELKNLIESVSVLYGGGNVLRSAG
jgi:hypothetical protein